MKTLTLILLVLIAATFAGCALPLDVADGIRQTTDNVVQHIDRDQDGYITSTELDKSKGNINMWMTGLFGLLGLLGLKRNGSQQQQIDELYDRERETYKKVS